MNDQIFDIFLGIITFHDHIISRNNSQIKRWQSGRHDIYRSGTLQYHVKCKYFLHSFYRERTVFLYPDWRSGYFGDFQENGLMIKGQETSVVNIVHDEDSYLPRLSTSDPSGPVLSKDESSKTHFINNPLRRDPYELRMVEIRNSTIKNAGHGLFITKAEKVNTVVAYFNGIRLEPSAMNSWNPFKKRSVYIVEAEDENGNDFLLDIPMEYSSVNRYNATSAHKVIIMGPFANHCSIPLTMATFNPL